MDVTTIEYAHLYSPTEFVPGKSINKSRQIIEATRFGKKYFIQKTSGYFDNFAAKRDFVIEEEMMHRLLHPAILKIRGISFEDFEKNRMPLVIFDTFENPTVDELCKNEESWSEEDRHVAILGIASGMEFLLKKGMRCGPLYANTIYIDEFNHPKLTNFGVFDYGSRDYEKLKEKELVKQFASLAIQILTGKESKNLEKTIENSIEEELGLILSDCIGNEYSRPTFEKITKKLLEIFEYEEPTTLYKEMIRYAGYFVVDDYTEISSKNRDIIKKIMDIYLKPPKKEKKEKKKKNGLGREYGYVEEEEEEEENDDDDDDDSGYDYEEAGGVAARFIKARNNRFNPLAGVFFSALYAVGYTWSSKFRDAYKFCYPPQWYCEEVIVPIFSKTKKIDLIPRLIAETKPNFVPAKFREMVNSQDPNELLRVSSNYRTGQDGFPKCPEAGWIYLKKAARMGNSRALLAKGQAYEEGIVVPMNLSKAKRIYEKAHQMGSSIARDRLRDLDEKCDELQNLIDNMPPDARDHYEKALKGDIFECIYVGFAFLYGRFGFPLSISHSYYIYKLAANKSGDVHCILGDAMRRGVGFPKNIIYARKHYLAGALLGSRRAIWLDCLCRKHMYIFNDKDTFAPVFKAIDEYFFVNKDSYGFDDSLTIQRLAFSEGFRMMNCQSGVDYQVKDTVYNYSRDEKAHRRSDGTAFFHPENSYFSIFDSFDYDEIKNPDVTILQYQLYSIANTFHRMREYGLFTVNYSFTINFDKKNPNNPNLYIFDNYWDTDYCYDQPFEAEIKMRQNYYRAFRELFEKIKLSTSPNEQTISKFAEQLNSGEQLDISFLDIANFFAKNFMDGVDEKRLKGYMIEYWNFQPIHTDEIAISPKVDSASLCNLDEQLYVGKSYFFGINGFPVNYHESAKFFKMAAYAKNREGLYWFTLMQSNGLGVPFINPKAIEDLKEAAELTKYPPIIFQYAVTLDRINMRGYAKSNSPRYNEDRVGTLIESIAHDNYADAQFIMGLHEESFPQLEIGRVKAAKYYLAAAKSGSMEALRRYFHVLKMNNDRIGIQHISRYLCGLLTPKFYYHMAVALDYESKYEEALYYLNLAKEFKYKKSYEMLGEYMRDGKGIPAPLYEDAERYFARAAKKIPSAVVKLANMIAEGVSRVPNFDTAKKVFQKVLNQSRWNQDTTLVLEYAKFLEHKQTEVAFNIYHRLASEKNRPECQYITAKWYFKGKGCRPNKKLAWKFLERAVEQKYSDAIYLTGKYKFLGKFTKSNIEEGLEFLSSACSASNVKASYFLAIIYHKGLGVRKNKELVDNFLATTIKYDFAKGLYLAYKARRVDKSKRYDYLMLASRYGYYKAQYYLAIFILENLSYNYDFDVHEKWRLLEEEKEKQKKLEEENKRRELAKLKDNKKKEIVPVQGRDKPKPGQAENARQQDNEISEHVIEEENQKKDDKKAKPKEEKKVETSYKDKELKVDPTAYFIEVFNKENLSEFELEERENKNRIKAKKLLEAVIKDKHKFKKAVTAMEEFKKSEDKRLVELGARYISRISKSKSRHGTMSKKHSKSKFDPDQVVPPSHHHSHHSSHEGSHHSSHADECRTSKPHQKKPISSEFKTTSATAIKSPKNSTHKPIARKSETNRTISPRNKKRDDSSKKYRSSDCDDSIDDIDETSS